MRERFSQTIAECAGLLVTGTPDEVAAAMRILVHLLGSPGAKAKPTKPAKRPNT
jgi:hypothetical protein